MSRVKVLPRWRRSWLTGLLIAGTLAGCGGGGGGGGDSSSTVVSGSGDFPPSSSLAQQCVKPRPAGTIDPLSGQPYGDSAGSAATEKAWVRSWINETYLWWNEVPAASAASYSDAVSYFDVLKTPQTTASGKAKDQFHFTYATTEWDALTQSDSDVGYGIQFAAFASEPPRNYVVAYTEAGSPAAKAGVSRGAQLVTVDGLDFASSPNADGLNAALFPASAGESHSFTFRDPVTAASTSITMKSARINHQPVPDVHTLQTASGPVGYMLFNDQTAAAEAALVSGIAMLKGSGIKDLILDIRYNGGGLLDIASELSYMLAGGARTAGKPFEVENFNSKNPFKLTLAERTTPFITTTQFSASSSALATLSLPRVFVLTGNDTCSASEAIMNSLRGVGVQVIQIGTTTCGKPYGFYPTDNCGTTFFSIQFQGVNAQGFGDYADGFVPNGGGSNGIPGCTIDDDFTHALGDPDEARLAAALSYRATGSCPTAASREAPSALRAIGPQAKLIRSPLRENRFFRPQPTSN